MGGGGSMVYIISYVIISAGKFIFGTQIINDNRPRNAETAGRRAAGHGTHVWVYL